MGDLKTLLLSILAILVAVLSPFDGQASPNPDDPARVFAICAGRLSALMEHQWMVDGPASEVTKRQRDAVVALVLAASRPEQQSQVMAWRVEAKAAQAALLSQAAFASNADLAARGARQAARLTSDCIGLTLPQS